MYKNILNNEVQCLKIIHIIYFFLYWFRHKFFLFVAVLLYVQRARFIYILFFLHIKIVITPKTPRQKQYWKNFVRFRFLYLGGQQIA